MAKHATDDIDLESKPAAKSTALNKLRGGDNSKAVANKGRKKVTSDQFAYWGMTKIDKDLADRAKIACIKQDITQVEFAQQAFTHYLKHLKL
jgi:hypothetical protein